MRKVVCKHCAKDWTIQHSCDSRESDSQTVIWVPVEASNIYINELEENIRVLKAKLALAKEALEEIANAGGFNSGADAETAREALEKLNKKYE